MNIAIKKAVLITLAAAFIFSVFAGCSYIETPASGSETAVVSLSPSPSPTVSATPSEAPTPSPSPEVTKEDIEKSLNDEKEKILDVTWSPDGSKVVFIKIEDKTAKVFVWKVNDAEASFVSEAEDTTDGFSWSPDSGYFLINVGHMGPGTITSTLVDAESAEALDTSLVTASISAPVWSPDSRFIALSTDDEETNQIDIIIYAVASRTSVSVLESTNEYGPYVVEKWEDDTLTYTEMSSSGERAELTLEFGE